MKHLVYSLALLVLTFNVNLANAADFTFSNLEQDDVDSILKEFSANFAHTSVSGAGSLGKIFGFEIGALGGMTTTPEIEKIAKESDPNADVQGLPHFALLGRLSVPMGITVDATFIPTFDAEGLEFNSTGLGVKWTATELFPLPVDVAVKGHITKTSLSYEQTSIVTGTVDIDTTTSGLTLLASKSFLFVEPYIGLGYLKSSGDMKYTGPGTMFSFTADDKASSDVSGTQFLVGAEANLFIFKLGAEYSSQFGTSRYALKAALYF